MALAMLIDGSSKARKKRWHRLSFIQDQQLFRGHELIPLGVQSRLDTILFKVEINPPELASERCFSALSGTKNCHGRELVQSLTDKDGFEPFDHPCIIGINSNNASIDGA